MSWRNKVVNNFIVKLGVAQPVEANQSANVFISGLLLLMALGLAM
jgi:hypothetical protein